MADTQKPIGKLPASRGRRVYLWLIFVGLVAVASSLVTLLIGYFSGNSPTITTLLAEGDGFLIAIAITADAFGKSVEQKRAHTPLALACGLVLVGSVIAFGFTKTELQNHKIEVDLAIDGIGRLRPDEDLNRLLATLRKPPYKEDRVANGSLFLMGAGLFTSFMVIIRSED